MKTELDIVGAGAVTSGPHFQIGERDGREGRGPSYVVPEYISGYERGRAEFLRIREENSRMGWDRDWRDDE